MPQPDDLVSLRDAATMVERDKRTIRRWVQAGKLERFEGPPPENGGSGVTLVSKSALLALVASTGQEPRQALDESGVRPSETGADTQGADVPDIGDDIAVGLQRLRGELALAKLQAELVEARTERDAIKGALESLQTRQASERQDYRLQLAQLREERDDWKDRHDAVRAELDARRAAGWTWFPRLLGA